jgi:hypothetical protein
MMHMPPPSAQETARAVELGHEPSTISVRGMLWFFIVFIASVAVIHVIVYVTYKQMVKYEHAQNIQRSVIDAGELLIPPEPRLQPSIKHHESTEPEDLAAMRGREYLEFVRRGIIHENGEFRFPDDVLQSVVGQGGSSQGAGVQR